MSRPTCPIYAVGNADRTQLAMRSDGVWFMRRREHKDLWGPWREQPSCPYPFNKYIDRRYGNAKLPAP